jgi:2-succinyl-5-enolpyruvyl-6-hydroxy-3-cyclohexene-1-carboxylate synthase
MNTNVELSAHLMHFLLTSGITEFCVCPGARNAPLIAFLSAHSENFKAYYFYEERSAAFFALGRIRRTGSPVAIITTSGTAAGELLPATMEAYYSGMPLILITADRPRNYRGSGAPQTAEQVGLFGIYVAESFDIEGDERPELHFSVSRPTHYNICFDEPLLVGEFPKLKQITEVAAYQSREVSVGASPVIDVQDFIHTVQNPLIIVGMLHLREREAVVRLLLRWEVPTYFEAVSGLREDPRLEPVRISMADQVMERARRADYPIEGFVRIGGIPTLRLWRDLEAKYANMNVLSLSALPFSGLGRPQTFFHGDLNVLCDQVGAQLGVQSGKRNAALARLISMDHEDQKRLRELLASEPTSEPGMIAELSQTISAQSQLYLGNSLPIREWDLAASYESKRIEVWGSRGLNGIDGQVSTFLGFSRENAENWAIIGDLTALYDLPGPWVLSQLPETQVTIVVVNNGGGKIFARMFKQAEFQNQHQVRFKAWADLWSLDYEVWHEVRVGHERGRGNRIIEMRPDENATTRFWKQYQELFS